MEGYIGEIRLFAGDFAPNNWAFCDGATLQVSAKTALFAVIGVAFGGDGRTTFALPDMRGAVAVGVGTGAGLSAVALGQTGTTGGAAAGLGTLGLNYIICTDGIFPSRS